MSDILYAHTDEQGIVWCGQGGVLAVNTSVSPEDFVNSTLFCKAKSVYIFRTNDNIRLLLAAYDKTVTSHTPFVPTVFVRKPYLIKDQTPEMLLHLLSMRDVTTRTVGNCNVFGLADYNACRFDHVMLSDSRSSDNTKRQLFKEHPAYKCLLMLPEYDEFAAMSLFLIIVDPRWFNDPLNPHRCNRLYSFLGLTRNGINSLATDNANVAASMAVALWVDQLDSGSSLINTSTLWLKRIYTSERTHERGLLKATRRLILYIRLNWLAALSPTGSVKFYPEQFFKREDEIAAYLTAVAATD